MNGYLVYDRAFQQHKTNPGHPENPNRLKAIREGCEKVDKPPWTIIEPSHRATIDRVTGVHDRDYIDRVKQASMSGQPLDADTPVSEKSYDTALLAAGTAWELTKLTNDDQVPGFGAIRPPGHHAESNRGMGFCLFNNVAIAANSLTHLNQKVAIVDIDVHHGNGTQKIFYDRDDVLYVSFHQFPFYPGTGHKNETGSGDGEGYTLNIPLTAGSGWSSLESTWENTIQEKIIHFNPGFILVSAGFDAHESDPVGGLNLRDQDYLRMARDLRTWANRTANGQIVGLLEGGYNLKTLRRLVPKFIQQLFS